MCRLDSVLPGTQIWLSRQIELQPRSFIKIVMIWSYTNNTTRIRRPKRLTITDRRTARVFWWKRNFVSICLLYFRRRITSYRRCRTVSIIVIAGHTIILTASAGRASTNPGASLQTAEEASEALGFEPVASVGPID